MRVLCSIITSEAAQSLETSGCWRGAWLRQPVQRTVTLDGSLPLLAHERTEGSIRARSLNASEFLPHIDGWSDHYIYHRGLGDQVL